jgi:hypothetical protein
MASSPTRAGGLSTTDTLLLTPVFACAATTAVLRAGAAITAVLSGHPVPDFNLGVGLMALAEHRGNPSTAWGQPVGPAWLYWTSTASVVAVLAAASAAYRWVTARNKTARGQDPRRIHGLASRAELPKSPAPGRCSPGPRTCTHPWPTPRSASSGIGLAVQGGWTAVRGQPLACTRYLGFDAAEVVDELVRV